MTIKQFLRPYWDLALLDNPLEDIVEGRLFKIRTIHHHYHDRWFADPFILTVSDTELSLLVEAFLYREQKGSIAKIVVDREKLFITRCHIILEGKHLSFPYVFRKDGVIRILPESSRDGILKAYVYDDNTETCRLENVICREPLVDALLTDRWGKDILVATKLPFQNGNTLEVWEQDRASGAFYWKYSIPFSDCIARNAGDFFTCQGVTYRPAQECNKWYGHAISLQKVVMNNDKLTFVECRRLYSGVGMHTFNTYQGVTVVDLKQFRIGWLSALAYKIHGKTDL